MKKTNKKATKKVAPKKTIAAPKKVAAKKVQKKIVKPVVKKSENKAIIKKMVAASKTLKKPVKKVAAKKPVVKIVTTKETSKNKKTMKTKWVKENPKRPAVIPQEPVAQLLDLSKVKLNKAPVTPVVTRCATVSADVVVPSTTSAGAPFTPAFAAAINSTDPSAFWHPVMPRQ